MLTTFKAITKPGATYACQSWSQLVKPTRIYSLDSSYKAILRVCCGLTKNTPGYHIHDEAGILPLSHEIKLMNQQYAISMMKSAGHPSNGLTGRRKMARNTTRSSKPPREPPLDFPAKTLDDWKNHPGSTKSLQKLNHTKFVAHFLANRPSNKILGIAASKVCKSEEELPRETRTELARLRCGHSRLCGAYVAKIENRSISPCRKYGSVEGDVNHLLTCISSVPLLPKDLWEKPMEVAEASTTPFDPGGNGTTPP